VSSHQSVLVLQAMNVHVDGMIWIKGSIDDYNNWAEATGDPRWAYYALTPYMEKARLISTFCSFNIVIDCIED
jgi:hypothetical protein